MQRKRAYHHGRLKLALLEAAIKLIAEVGYQGFTLREVARRAGVSHNAPYRHFKDRDELLAAVAAEGFDRLTAAMLESARGGETALERLRRSGQGYVAFALSWPEHFTVMFEGAAGEGSGESRAAGRRAFGTLVEFVKACQSEGSLPAGEPLPYALLAWAAVHGIAKLAVAGRLPFSSEEQVFAFTGRMTEALTRGAQAAAEKSETH